jgi:hypothetical protein
MRYATIILGIIAATFLLPEIAFARGGKHKGDGDRRKRKAEVVTEPVVVVKRDRRKPEVVVKKEHKKRKVVVEKRRRKPVVVVEKHRPQKTVVVRHGSKRHHHARGQGHYRGHHDRYGYHGPRWSRHRQHRHHSCCQWVPGHYEHEAHAYTVPGYFRNERVPPRYVERRGPRGYKVKVMVHPGGLRKVWVPPEHKVRYEKVWVEGYYTCSR